MTSYFVYGAISHPAIQNAILGTGHAPASQSAELAGHCLPGGAGPFAWAQEDSGHTVTGTLLHDLSDDALLRMSHIATVLGGIEQTVLVKTSSGEVRARIMLGVSEGVALLDIASIQMIELLATQEIMSYLGDVDRNTLAARRGMILSRAAARQAAHTSKPTELRSDTHHDQIEVLTEDTPHAGFFLTRSYSLRHPKFDDTTSPELRREVFVATDAAIVLPYDPVRDRVLLVEQFRMGPFGRGDVHPWVLEPVAGRLDAGETPEQCARRECEEEAGLALHRLEKITSHYCSPGCSTEYFHMFLGLCDLPDETKGFGGLETEHEDIRIHIVSYARAMALLDSGEADNGPLVLALLWLSKTRDALRASA